MDSLPPAGSTRRRLVFGFWIVFTIVFATLLVYGVFRWAGGAEMPMLAGIGGVGSVIGVWRWIAEKSRA